MIFIIFLLFGFFVRLNYSLSYPLDNLEVSRDWLVSRHIIQYGEFPLMGGWNGVYGAANSPAYYYILAFFIFIKDDIIFLQLVNIYLLTYSAFIIYILGGKIFGKPVGLAASILFMFSQEAFNQSGNIWAPYVMQPILLASCLILYLAYSRKSLIWLFASLPVFALACAVHNSVFGLLPLFAILVLLVIRASSSSVMDYFKAAFVGALSFLVLYLPVLVTTRSGCVSPDCR